MRDTSECSLVYQWTQWLFWLHSTSALRVHTTRSATLISGRRHICMHIRLMVVVVMVQVIVMVQIRRFHLFPFCVWSDSVPSKLHSCNLFSSGINYQKQVAADPFYASERELSKLESIVDECWFLRSCDTTPLICTLPLFDSHRSISGSA